ncbi:hypothetical protein MRB53_012703 [Persea americana]|uniref:Uncharacterized protein n=1 Tax=Persea americana TaxID=3435 RepID=A0ACC2LZC3_PERAE|nr:hypothetical protein MRB53_012703 [Persea americana]
MRRNVNFGGHKWKDLSRKVQSSEEVHRFSLKPSPLWKVYMAETMASSQKEDLNTHVPSSPPDIGNTQNDVQQETFEENGMEELMTNVRRKRPCPSKSKRDVRNGKFDENLERLVNVLEQESKHDFGTFLPPKASLVINNDHPWPAPGTFNKNTFRHHPHQNSGINV